MKRFRTVSIFVFVAWVILGFPFIAHKRFEPTPASKVLAASPRRGFADPSGMWGCKTSPNEKWEVCSQKVGDNPDIVLVDPVTGQSTNLSANPAYDDGADWAPDSRHIVFASDRDGSMDLYVIQVDGSGLTNLTRHPAWDGWPAWSPDTKHIAFVSDRDGQPEIFVMNADGNAPVRLTSDGLSPCALEWSADGQKIRYRAGEPSGEEKSIVFGTPGTDDVTFVADETVPDGTVFQPGESFEKSWKVRNAGDTEWLEGYRLTFESGDRMGGPEGEPLSTTPAGETAEISVPLVAPTIPGSYTGRWRLSNANGEAFGELLSVVIEVVDSGNRQSPDSGRILFSACRHENCEIYVMDPDGTGQTRLTTATGLGELLPSWSPDGRLIAFESMQYGHTEIHIMGSDGGNRRILSANGGGRAAWSPDGQRLAFMRRDISSESDVNLEIYAINVDGTGLVNLTNTPAWDMSPDWSPDGSQIAFASGGEICLMNANGTDIHCITQNTSSDEYPVWSPDGLHIAFASDRDGNIEIFVMNTDGSDQRKLTSMGGGNIWPTWSPDGRQIAFEHYEDADDAARGFEHEIWVVNSDGTNARNISEHPSSNDMYPWWGPETHPTEVRAPASAEADLEEPEPQSLMSRQAFAVGQIAFTSSRDGNNEIYMVHPDGTGERRLTYTPDVDENFPSVSPDGTQVAFEAAGLEHGHAEIHVMNIDGSNPRALSSDGGWRPTWSPDGTQIAFTMRDPEAESQWAYEVYVVNVDGSNLRNLTNNPAWDSNPDWSPDGSRIAFTSNRDGAREGIYVMDADGSDPVRLSSDSVRDQHPVWSPDGQQLAFVSEDMEIYLMRSDGSDRRKLTSLGGDSMYPVWSPDGNEIAFEHYTPDQDGHGTPDSIYAVSLITGNVRQITRGLFPGSWSGQIHSPTEPTSEKVIARPTPVAQPVSDATRRDRIVFECSDEGPFDICIMDADGSNRGHLTSDEGTNALPKGSPDGRYVAFLSQRDGNDELYVMNSDGTGITNLSNNPGYDFFQTWSPDSRSILLLSAKIGEGGEYCIAEIGNGKLNWLDFSGSTTSDLSPDGERVVYVSGTRNDQGIYVRRIDGTDSVRVAGTPEVSGSLSMPTWSPSGDHIAFVVGGADYYESSVFVVNADGSELKSVSESAPGARNPAWSPDGKRIVFVSNIRLNERGGTSEIHSVNADGTDLMQLTNNFALDETPVWSPDGQRIAFASRRDGNFEIYVMNADGSNQLRLTNDPTNDQFPSWLKGAEMGDEVIFQHPDNGADDPSTEEVYGERPQTDIAQVPIPVAEPAPSMGQQDRIVFECPDEEQVDICAMDADGANRQRLTNTPDDDQQPIVSPDGRFVAFTARHDGNTDVYVMNADGTDLRQLTHTEDNELDLAWSPDSQSIAFVTAWDGNSEIYVTSLDGSHQINLTENAARDAAPAWSSDGQRIAFVRSANGGGSDLYVMNADGSEQILVSRADGELWNAYCPAWSPDSRRIAFSYGPLWRGDLYVVSADGSSQTRLTDSTTQDGMPIWSPDGQWILFETDQMNVGTHVVMNVCRINQDGTGYAKLTNTDVNTCSSKPALSYDGKQILFTRSTRSQGVPGPAEIWVMNADGSGAHELGQGSYAKWVPVWHRSVSEGPAMPDSRTAKGITGLVVDELTGSALQGARVSLGDLQTTTDPQGNFSFPDVAEGEYTFSVAAEGYETKTLPHLTVFEGASMNLKIGLKIFQSREEQQKTSAAQPFEMVSPPSPSESSGWSDEPLPPTAPEVVNQPKIVFASNDGLSEEQIRDREAPLVLYLMNADGTGVQRISHEFALTTQTLTDLSWSPTNGRLLVVFKDQMLTMNLDGSGVRRIDTIPFATTIAAARWSPDGNYIAFSDRIDGDDEIYVMDANGQNLRQITSNQFWDWRPAWSPDGAYLAFAACPAGDAGLARVEKTGLYRAEVCSGGIVPIVENDGVYRCDWSPDGEQIVYTSNMRGFDKSDLIVVRPDGSGRHNLTQGDFSDDLPRWSPDGGQIVFRRRQAWQDLDGEIWIISADGTGEHKLANGCHPEWVVEVAEIAQKETTPEPIEAPMKLAPQLVDQTGSGEITGWVVEDDTGKVIKGAQVTVGSHETTTDGLGNFVLKGLPPGQYGLVVSHEGYDPYISQVISLADGDSVDVEVRLQHEGTAEYPEDPMRSHPVADQGAQTAQEAEQFARAQGLKAPVMSSELVHLRGRYLVNYKIGDQLFSAPTDVDHDAWKLTDATGHVWYVVQTCGNLALSMPSKLRIPQLVPRMTPTPEPRLQEPQWKWIAGASEQFSNVQGNKNWYYRVRDISGYHEMPWDPQDEWWQWGYPHEKKMDYVKLMKDGGHPGPGVDVARVWESPVSGTIRIKGRAHKYPEIHVDGYSWYWWWEGCLGGDGVIVYIKKNGQELWKARIGGYDWEGYGYDITTDVQPGDRISFEINLAGTPEFDGTYFDPGIYLKQ